MKRLKFFGNCLFEAHKALFGLFPKYLLRSLNTNDLILKGLNRGEQS